MALESLLRVKGIDPSATVVFVDSNALFLAHPDEVRRFHYHTTEGARSEIEEWAKVQERKGRRSQVLEALRKIDPQQFLDAVLYNPIFDNTLRYERAKAAVDAMDKARLIVCEKKVPEDIHQVAVLGGKRLAAEASKHYMHAWESTVDEDWRHKQIKIAVEYAMVRYSKGIEELGLSSMPEYQFTKDARVRNISRHVGYLFDEFILNPQNAFNKADNRVKENCVDQGFLWTASQYRPWQRDRKRNDDVVIVTKDIDFIELLADISAYNPRMVRRVKIIPPP